MRLVALDQLERALAVLGNFNTETPCGDELAPSLARCEIVFGDQNPFFNRHKLVTASNAAPVGAFDAVPFPPAAVFLPYLPSSLGWTRISVPLPKAHFGFPAFSPTGHTR